MAATLRSTCSRGLSLMSYDATQRGTKKPPSPKARRGVLFAARASFSVLTARVAAALLPQSFIMELLEQNILNTPGA
jgi:hypothetical protein